MVSPAVKELIMATYRAGIKALGERIKEIRDVSPDYDIFFHDLDDCINLALKGKILGKHE